MKNLTKNIWAPPAVLISVLLAPGTDAASFQGLGFLPGPDYGFFESYAYGVSDDGSTVVGWGNSTTSFSEAFRWTQVDGMVGLGNIPDNTASGALGASADGSVIVGWSGSGPFRWTQAQGMVSLDASMGGSASDVSANGSVIVGTASSVIIDSEAFRWTVTDGMMLLGDLPGSSTLSEVNALSADGLVVVGGGNLNLDEEAFRWTATDGMVGLGDLPGGIFYSSAQGVSADGSVIVGISRSALVSEAFRWTASGGMIGLGSLPGGQSSAALDVSADGSIIVGEGLFNSNATAFIWDQPNGMRSLRDVLINDLGLGGSLDGWHLASATGISANGLTIVGYGFNPKGQPEAWIARLDSSPNPTPIPATPALLAAGALAALIRQRARRT
jgi:probable HAF family extracellular repeat protein